LAISTKFLYFNTISVAKPDNIVVFAFTYVLESLALLYRDFTMNSYSVDGDAVMKQGDEAINISLFQFFRIIKQFIATTLYSALNASSALQSANLKLIYQ
jgi:hypothetical protein